MRWAFGIGIGAALAMTVTASAAEPLSVYPANWTGMKQSTPPKVENLLDTFRERITTVAATEVMPSTTVPSTPHTATTCSTCSSCASTASHRSCGVASSGRVRFIARRIWECYTWTPGPAVIPRCVTYPYPGAWMTSMPPMPSPGFTPTPGYNAACGKCGQTGSPAQADPAGPYRGIVGGPVLMPASGGYVPPIVRTRETDRISAPTAQPPVAPPPAARPQIVKPEQPKPSAPMATESQVHTSRVMRPARPTYRIDQPYYPVEEEIPLISRVARFFSSEREIAGPVAPAEARTVYSGSTQERVILPTLGTRSRQRVAPATPAQPPLTLYPNQPFTNP